MRCRRRSSSPFYQNINSQQISLCSEFWHTCILNINTWQRFFFQFRLRFCHLGCFDNKDGRPMFLAARILNHYSTDNVGLTLFCWRFFPTENEKICEGQFWACVCFGVYFEVDVYSILARWIFFLFIPCSTQTFFIHHFFRKSLMAFWGKNGKSWLSRLYFLQEEEFCAQWFYE